MFLIADLVSADSCVAPSSSCQSVGQGNDVIANFGQGLLIIVGFNQLLSACANSDKSGLS